MEHRDRFYGRFIVTPRGCWEWTGYRDENGYGRFTMSGKLWKAHRASWILHVGAIPEGEHVCHSCDNPPCVNPTHLHLGDDADNARERNERKRQARGESNGKSTLSVADIYGIRAELRSGARQVDIGAMYGITHQTVSKIKNGLLWGHVEG